MSVAPKVRGILVWVADEDRDEAGHVGRLTVNGAARRNALGNDGKRTLAKAIEQVATDPALRAVMLTGAGERSSISGADVAVMSGFTVGHASEGPSLARRVGDAIRAASVPVIAGTNRHFFGAGLEIATPCDIRAAADSARFRAPRV